MAPNNRMGYQPRPVQTPPPSRPISQNIPQRPPAPMQQPPQSTRIDSTQGGGVQNETPSFMKRLLGNKRRDNK